MEHQDVSDHDLLIELRTEMRGMRDDIKRMGINTDKTMNDHENRIRELERATESVPLLTKIVYGMVGFILIAVLSSILYLILPSHT